MHGHFLSKFLTFTIFTIFTIHSELATMIHQYLWSSHQRDIHESSRRLRSPPHSWPRSARSDAPRARNGRRPPAPRRTRRLLSLGRGSNGNPWLQRIITSKKSMFYKVYNHIYIYMYVCLCVCLSMVWRLYNVIYIHMFYMLLIWRFVSDMWYNLCSISCLSMVYKLYFIRNWQPNMFYTKWVAT